MDLHPVPVRHAVSLLNPALIESWCLKCGMFIAASDDVRKLQTAENTHACISNTRKEPADRQDGA
jgi:hypothetical protein